MSLDFMLAESQPTVVYSANITHNLAGMAGAAGLYLALWRPEELPDVKVAADLVPFLRAGLERLQSEPGQYKGFEPANGWGTYHDLVRFAEEALEACERFPHATVETCR
jgi:hypothetical protein